MMLQLTSVHEDHRMEWYEERQLDPYSYIVSLCTYGNCVYWVDGQKMIVDKGELLLIPPGCFYYGKSIPTHVHTKQVLHFSTSNDVSAAAVQQRGERGTAVPATKDVDVNVEVDAQAKPDQQAYSEQNEHALQGGKMPVPPLQLQPTGLPLLERSHVLHIKPGSYERLHDIIKQIVVQWREKPTYYECMSEGLLLQLLVEINREYDRGQMRDDKQRLVEQMKRHIQQHYSSRITKEQLGDVIRRTPNYAATLFKDVTGQTISQYMHDERMKRAVYMLTESQLTVAEIAEFLGYAEVSYFYRIFKKKMGIPPAEMMQERPPMR